jgi:hypothetical protein
VFIIQVITTSKGLAEGSAGVFGGGCSWIARRECLAGAGGSEEGSCGRIRREDPAGVSARGVCQVSVWEVSDGSLYRIV